MSWRKDLKSKPKEGRYFPLQFGEVVRLLKVSQLVQYDGERLAIRMENVEKENEHGRLLIDLMPEQDVTIYSVPEEIAPKLAEKAATCALSGLTKVQERLNNMYGTQYSYYCAYLSDHKSITITRKDIRIQKGKYRDRSKFTNAFKPKKINRDEVVLETVDI
jgi:hypothetical protein